MNCNSYISPVIRYLLGFCLFITTPTLLAAERATCPMVKMEAERLPDMHVPRMGHSFFCVNGEPTVVGGHTSGFVPTATAEYYKDGEWHLMNTIYAHDDGFSVVHSSGRVLLGGGHSESLGIGQTFNVEWYDPVTHTFNGFGCLDRRRSLASALEIDSGRVVIAGNHYADDAIEIFDGKEQFTFFKEQAAERSRPLIFRIAKNNVLILGQTDNMLVQKRMTLADRLHGEPIDMPLLHVWNVSLSDLQENHTADSFTGDEDKGVYTYLIPMSDSCGQVAIAQLWGTELSLLPTVCDVPENCQWGKICWGSSIIVVDRQAERGYLTGIGNDNRIFVLSIEYTKNPAPLTLYYTDPLPVPASGNPVLTPDGDLILAGGNIVIENDQPVVSNYNPYASAILLRLGKRGIAAEATATASYWPVVIVCLALAIMALLVLWMLKNRKHGDKTPITPDLPDTIHTPETIETPDATAVNQPDNELLRRINAVMKEQQLFKKSGLKVSDVASALGTNINYVSDCINKEMGCSFTQFVNNYRIAYVQQKLHEQPDTKIATLFTEAGFSTEASFFRNFKAITGMTPREWINTLD